MKKKYSDKSLFILVKSFMCEKCVKCKNIALVNNQILFTKTPTQVNIGLYTLHIYAMYYFRYFLMLWNDFKLYAQGKNKTEIY